MSSTFGVNSLFSDIIYTGQVLLSNKKKSEKPYAKLHKVNLSHSASREPRIHNEIQWAKNLFRSKLSAGGKK